VSSEGTASAKIYVEYVYSEMVVLILLYAKIVGKTDEFYLSVVAEIWSHFNQ
jgi:hypothetical protein